MSNRRGWLGRVLVLSTGLAVGVFPALSPAASRAASGASSIHERLATVLDGLPREVAPSGLLLDRGLVLADPRGFDGSADARAATLVEWRQLYLQIGHAALEPLAWPSLGELDALARAAGRSGEIPVAILDATYERLRASVVDDGLLVARGDRFALSDPSIDAARVAESGRLFAAAPLRAHTYRGGEARFRFDPEIAFGHPTAIDPGTPLAVDFEDGRGARPVIWGDPVVVRYSEVGAKRIRVQLGDAMASFIFDVRALGTPSPDDTLHVTGSPYLGVAGTGDAYVYLADGHAAITNPVVVIEGFDLDNSMGWDELYALLNREGLLETLRADGYDAVVLDFTDAVTHLQRNGLVAVELIEQVRDAIGPSQTMALVGASMGGIVGRYALASMENESNPHQVRTFVSFDSPQRGAVIPLGIQYWVAFFADDAAEAGALLAALDSPGARQMLAYHHTDPPGGTGQPDPLRGQLLADLTALGGYPTLPRLVAMANGSGAQANQGFGPSAKLVDWNYTSFLVDITGDVWALPNPGAGTIFHGLIDFILLPADEQFVSVSGTLPYDGAPGGWRASMAQMDAVPAPYGDIVALHANHCFIPTVSALDLATNDLFYDVAGDPDLLALTPFDALYFPSANQEHVLITAENAPWILDEIADDATGVAVGPGSEEDPRVASIEAVAPQPATGGARVQLWVPRAGSARLTLHDVNGREVLQVASAVLAAGRTELPVTLGDLRAGGVYFLRLRGDGFAATRKLVVR